MYSLGDGPAVGVRMASGYFLHGASLSCGDLMTTIRNNSIVLAIAILLLQSCAMVPLHPGAVSKLDSQSFDVLLIAQAVIDQGRAELAAGSLPEGLRPGLMRLIDAYNIARSAWLTYRNAVKAGTAVNEQTMKSAMETLSAALNAFQRSRAIPTSWSLPGLPIHTPQFHITGWRSFRPLYGLQCGGQSSFAGSNCGPSLYESVALPSELKELNSRSIA